MAYRITSLLIFIAGATATAAVAHAQPLPAPASIPTVGNETIIIKERKPPKVLPQPVRNYHMAQPPYSATRPSTDKDVWATARRLSSTSTRPARSSR